MAFDFSGQTVLVTGASRGIGEQIARDVADGGGTLLVTSTEASHKLEDRFGVATHHFPIDFRHEADTRHFLAELRAMDRVDVCINNAGVARHNLLEEASVEEWDDTATVNVKIPYLITQAVAEPMKRHQYGRIVNISSVWGHMTKPSRSVYTAAKHGVRGVTVGTAVELAPFNVLVNTVCPGFTRTDMFNKNYAPEEQAQAASRVPLKRLAEPGEISTAVLFLASKMNTYITGQSLLVDGGYSIG